MKKSKFANLSFDNVETLTKEQKAEIIGGNGYYTPYSGSTSGFSGATSNTNNSSGQGETFGKFVCRWGNGWLWKC